MSRDRDASRLAAESLAEGDPTGWFDRLYVEAESGGAIVPWDSGAPSAMLVEWATGRASHVGRAMVVGCGLGRDAEFVASLGYDTAAFDIAPAAIAGARTRHPDTAVDYGTADLFTLPDVWQGAFDFVLESHTVQSLPVPLHRRAIAAVTSLLAPGGTLLVLGAVGTEGEDVNGPPWPLTRAEIDAFAADDLSTVQVERVPGAVPRWRVEFRR